MRDLVSLEKAGVDPAILRSSGLKRTRPREVVYGLLDDAQREALHLDVEALYRQSMHAGERVSISSIYRVLAEFEEAGLVQAHAFLGMRKVYELETGQSRDHLVNIDTQQIIHLPPDALDPYCASLSEDQGVAVVHRNVTLYVREIPSGSRNSLPAHGEDAGYAERMTRKVIRRAMT